MIASQNVKIVPGKIQIVKYIKNNGVVSSSKYLTTITTKRNKPIGTYAKARKRFRIEFVANKTQAVIGATVAVRIVCETK